jgi:hypothetical protein
MDLKVPVPFYTADPPLFLEQGYVKGAAVGLNPGLTDEDYLKAYKMAP